jgi:hypothetical protein
MAAVNWHLQHFFGRRFTENLCESSFGLVKIAQFGSALE